MAMFVTDVTRSFLLEMIFPSSFFSPVQRNNHGLRVIRPVIENNASCNITRRFQSAALCAVAAIARHRIDSDTNTI